VPLVAEGFARNFKRKNMPSRAGEKETAKAGVVTEGQFTQPSSLKSSRPLRRKKRGKTATFQLYTAAEGKKELAYIF